MLSYVLILQLDNTAEELFHLIGQSGLVVHVSGLSDDFSGSRIGMDNIGELSEARSGLHCQCHFADHVAGILPDDGRSQDLVRFGIHTEPYKTGRCRVANGTVIVLEVLLNDTVLRFADHLSFFSLQMDSSTFESQCCGSFFIFFTPHTVVNVPAQT